MEARDFRPLHTTWSDMEQRFKTSEQNVDLLIDGVVTPAIHVS